MFKRWVKIGDGVYNLSGYESLYVEETTLNIVIKGRCNNYTQDLYIGRSRQSVNDIFSAITTYLAESCKINKDTYIEL